MRRLHQPDNLKSRDFPGRPAGGAGAARATGVRTAVALCLGLGSALALAAPMRPAANANADSKELAPKAKVTVKDKNGEIKLKHEEQIAFMFIAAIDTLEDDCLREIKRPCTLAELLDPRHSPETAKLRKLKYDPNKSDPNYTYSVTVQEDKWEAAAVPNKPGLGGMYDGGGLYAIYYNPDGPATRQSDPIIEGSVEGDIFITVPTSAVPRSAVNAGEAVLIAGPNRF